MPNPQTWRVRHCPLSSLSLSPHETKPHDKVTCLGWNLSVARRSQWIEPWFTLTLSPRFFPCLIHFPIIYQCSILLLQRSNLHLCKTVLTFETVGNINRRYNNYNYSTRHWRWLPLYTSHLRALPRSCAMSSKQTYNTLHESLKIFSLSLTL